MSNSLAYYLKYRPQTLSEIIGQEVVKKNLLASFQNNKLSHAYLFVGPRGTGKTSTARILAKMVNCESLESSDKSLGENNDNNSRLSTLATSHLPCNKCVTCISITDGSNLDLIEIDAASNRGIEDIRFLREKIKLSPSSARKKVYIIDEVHMLTTEAFNALLKTLEEPPAHVLFILATTEIAKVPQTILSRVQRFDFKLAASGELLEALKKIVKLEKIDIDEGALRVLIKKADGSFRDGVKLLDQVSSIGGKITAKLAAETVKSSHLEDILKLIQHLQNRNSHGALLELNEQLENGTDAGELILSLMDTLRSLVLIKYGAGEQLVKPKLTEDKYQSLVQLGQDFTGLQLISSLKVLQEALENLKFASISSLPLELAVVEICDESTKLEEKTEMPVKSEPTNPDVILGSPDSDSVGTDLIGGTPESTDQADSGLTSSFDILRTNEIGSSITSDISKLKEKWTFVLETIRQVNFSLEALLRSINIRECSEATVVMEVPYSFHQRILEAPKNRDLLEGILSDILGRSIRISIILGSRPRRKEDIANIELAQDDEIIRAAAEIFNSDTVN